MGLAALAVAVLLAGITGFVDAVGVRAVPRGVPGQPERQRGVPGDGDRRESVSTEWRPATAMVGFALGIVVGELLRRRVRGPRARCVAARRELALFLAVIAIAGPIDRVHLIGGAKGFVLIVLTSMAMGVQTEVIRHVAGTAVATTYQTGAIARMGEAVSRVVSRTGRLREEREVVVLLRRAGRVRRRRGGGCRVAGGVALVDGPRRRGRRPRSLSLVRRAGGSSSPDATTTDGSGTRRDVPRRRGDHRAVGLDHDELPVDRDLLQVRADLGRGGAAPRAR